MEFWIWILLGFVVFGLVVSIAVIALTVLAFAFIASGQLEKEDSDFK